MKITIKGTNIKLTPEIYHLINEKIGTLDKFIKDVNPALIKADVEVGITTRHHQQGDIYRAEVNIGLPGNNLRAEAERENIDLAITEVKDELQRQLKKYKGKQTAEQKREGRLLKFFLRCSPLAYLKRKGRRERNEGG